MHGQQNCGSHAQNGPTDRARGGKNDDTLKAKAVKQWTAWLAVGAVLQALGLKVERPLTRWVRAYIVATNVGSAFLGGALVWVIYHWLWDMEGIGLFDVLWFILGAVFGLIAWGNRQKEKT
jgi:hypothetical protein